MDLPLLDSALKERAEQALDRLIDRAVHETFGLENVSNETDRASLEFGLPGTIVFLSEVAASRDDEEIASSCVELLLQHIDSLVESAQQAGLARGLSGIGFAVEHLRALDLVDDVDGITEPLRDAALSALDTTGLLPFELAFGTAGIGVFGLERFVAAGDEVLAMRALERLKRQSSGSPWGRAWRSPADPRSLGFDLCERFPDGLYDTGMLHGVAGALSFCAAMAKAGLGRETALDLCNEGLQWLKALEQRAGPPRWPCILDWKEKTGQGWCRGALGISTALVAAAQAVGSQADVHWALACARDAFAVEESPAWTLCHGAAGTSIIGQVLWRETGDGDFADRARQSVMRCADYIESDLEKFSPGLFLGGAGVGVALLAALDPGALSWTRAFLPGLAPATRTESR